MRQPSAIIAACAAVALIVRAVACGGAPALPHPGLPAWGALLTFAVAAFAGPVR